MCHNNSGAKATDAKDRFRGLIVKFFLLFLFFCCCTYVYDFHVIIIEADFLICCLCVSVCVCAMTWSWTCIWDRPPCSSPTRTPSSPRTMCIRWASFLVWMKTIVCSRNVRVINARWTQHQHNLIHVQKCLRFNLQGEPTNTTSMECDTCSNVYNLIYRVDRFVWLPRALNRPNLYGFPLCVVALSGVQLTIAKRHMSTSSSTEGGS